MQILLPVFFINLVSEAHSVDDSEFEAHITLLEFIRVGFQRYSRLVVLGGLTLELGVEQCVHQSGLAQTRLSYTTKQKHQVSEVLILLFHHFTYIKIIYVCPLAQLPPTF